MRDHPPDRRIGRQEVILPDDLAVVSAAGRRGARRAGFEESVHGWGHSTCRPFHEV